MTADEKWHKVIDILNRDEDNTAAPRNYTEEERHEILQLLNEAMEEGHAGAFYTMGCLYYFNDGVVQPDYEQGVTLAQKALDMGYERAKLLLSEAYFTGTHVPVDREKAERYLRDLVDGNHSDACFRLALHLMFGSIPDGDYQEGLALLSKAVELGYKNAFLYAAETAGRYCQEDRKEQLLQMHRNTGRQVPQKFMDDYGPDTLPGRRLGLFDYYVGKNEYDKAIADLEEGSAVGEITAEERLADAYYFGIGEQGYAQNEARAMEMYKSLAGRGSAFAYYRIGMAKLDSAEDDHSRYNAKQYIHRAANMRFAPAEYAYSSILYGEGDRDFENVRFLLEDAASQGYGDALKLLASTYIQDNDVLPLVDYAVEKDVERGINYLHRAAWQCNAEARVALAKCYRDGKYVEKNETFAFNILRRTIDIAPEESSLMLLGDFFYDGVGTEVDKKTAFLLYKRVADTWNNYAAKMKVAVMYFAGDGVEKDESLAAEYYAAAKEIVDFALYGAIPLSEAKARAKNGDAEAMYQLGQRYKDGDGVEFNIETASDWWLKAAMKGHCRAMHDLAIYYLTGKEDYTNGLKWLEKACDAGSPLSMVVLSDAYRTGKYGLEPDSEKVVYYLEKAAELDDEQAQFTLCSYYHDGTVVEKNLDIAKQWFEKFYAHKSGFGYYRMALCYLNGDMYPQSDEDMKVQLELSIGEGYEEAYQCYYDLLWRGEADKMDRTRALPFFEGLAQNSDNLAKYYLSKIYADETNPDMDLEKSKAMLVSAAEDGHAMSQAELGAMLIVGDGVDSDPARGFEYLRSAANDGNTRAMVNLGYYLINGINCEKNADEGIQWAEEGARRGDGVAASYAAKVYFIGIEGVIEKDFVRAYNILQPHAKASVENCILMAEICEAISMERNSYSWELAEQAFTYMSLAAQKGSPEALYKIAKYHALGIGCFSDLNLAVFCYDLILRMDSVDEQTKEDVRSAKEIAQAENARAYRFQYLEEIVDANPDKVMTRAPHLDENGCYMLEALLRKAMECGELGAYDGMAWIVLKEQPDKAYEYAKHVAEHGYAGTSYQIGHLYLTGDEDIPSDIVKARAFLTLGAQTGDLDSIYEMSFIMTLPGNSEEDIQTGIGGLQYVINNTEEGEDLHNRALSLLSKIQKKRNSVLSKVKSVFGKK